MKETNGGEELNLMYKRSFKKLSPDTLLLKRCNKTILKYEVRVEICFIKFINSDKCTPLIQDVNDRGIRVEGT